MRLPLLRLRGPGMACVLMTCAAISVVQGAAETVSDTLKVRGKDPVKGRFEGYRNGRFFFKPADGGKQLEELRIKVESLDLSPVAEVSLKASGKMQDGVTLKHYRQPYFTFTIDGRESQMSAGRVTAIEPTLDFKRGASGSAGPDGSPMMDRGPADLERYVRTGVV